MRTTRLPWLVLALVTVFAPAARAEEPVGAPGGAPAAGEPVTPPYPNSSQPPPPAPYPYQSQPPPPTSYQPVYRQPPDGPEEIADFDEDQPVPFGYTKVSKTRKGPIIGGAIAFGVTFGISLSVAAIGNDLHRSGETTTSFDGMWYPIVGPFIQAARSESSIARLSLGVLGVGQTAGAVLLVYGLTSPRKLLVRNDQLSMSITPMISEQAQGAMVFGSF